MANHDLLDDVLAQLQDYGLKPVTPLVIGKRTRCECDGDKPPEKTGWYVVYEHLTGEGRTLYCGSFGDWRSGEKGSWQKIKPKGGRLSAEDRAVMKARAEEGQRKAAQAEANKHRTAARRAAGMWKRLAEKGTSAYLDAKRVVGFGLRYAAKSGTALVPMRNVKGDIVGLQVLYPAKQEKTGRNKTYWPYGLEKEGAYHLIGPEPEPGDVILIAEGYATGASLHMATSLTVCICFDAGNLLPVAQAMRTRFPGRQLVFCADDDWKTVINGQPYNTGVMKANNASLVVGGQVVAPVFDNDREDGWSDFNDLHCAEGLDAVRRQVLAVVRPATDEGWREKLQYAEKGGLIAHPFNVALILGNDRRWEGVVAYDSFSSKIRKMRTPPYGGKPGDWSDLDDVRVTLWLAEVYGLRVKSAAVLEAVNAVAHDNAFHPVKDYLDALEWDQTPRLEHWLHAHLGVADGDYSRKVAKRWMLSAVARVFEPGCKADSVLILEGIQGAGKSTSMSVLGGAWFMDTPFNLGDKDGYQAIRGKWIIELGELDAFNKAESTRAKQFFSASVDTYRESYGRRVLDVPRQCVFVGTTNQDEYLKDDTGNRRYWPVTCTKVELNGLRADRDQLWAEAVACYRAGHIWWVERDEVEVFASEQDQRYQADMWEEPIIKYLIYTHSGESVTGAHILEKALNIDPSHWDKPAQMRVGKILHRLKWPRRRLGSTPSGTRGYVYMKPAEWKRGSVPAAKKEPAF